MKNTFKILVVLFTVGSLVFSSCKKEETILLGCTDSTALNFNNLANTDDGNCEYEMIVDGCTDIVAMNYQPLANNDNGSCVFAYDISQGIWNITSACDDLIISIPLVGDFPVPLNDMFPETIKITGEGVGVVSMDINQENVLADVAYDGTVTIQDGQKISLDTGDFGVVDVEITGSGKIETATNGDLTLNLAFEVPLSGTQSSSCEISFTK